MFRTFPPLRYSLSCYSTIKSSCSPLIGLEIHAQLTNSNSKLFSPAHYSFASPPNSQVDIFDAALPGSMPMLNRDCVEWTIVAALGLNCRINHLSRFDRKHYFYSDSPAGFQITQHAHPIAEDGWLEYVWKSADGKCTPLISKAKIRRIQLEQDTGKSLQDENTNRSLIDLNRAGVGLIEIVTDPVFTSSRQAAAFVNELATLLRYLRVCSANMSTGEMRVDINVSVGPTITQQGPVVEVKNVNSLRAIRYAIDYEIFRQRKISQSGGTVINETRSFDLSTNKTSAMRDKEVVQDYRFLPEPNLPPIRIVQSCGACSSGRPSISSGEFCVGCVRLKHDANFAQLPNHLRRELVFQYGLPLERASPLVDEPRLCSLFFSTASFILSNLSSFEEKVLAVQGIQRDNLERLVHREVAFWCSGLLHGNLRDRTDFSLPSPKQLSDFVILTLTGQIFGTEAEQVLNELCTMGTSASALQIAAQRGFLLSHDLDTIQAVCEDFIRANPVLVQKYLSKGRKRGRLQSMADQIVRANQNAEVLNKGLVERCLSDLLNRINDTDTLTK